MDGKIIVDTGPLYAFLDKRDQYHFWVSKQFAELEPPFLTCESVLSETIFLLQRENIDINAIFEIVNRGDLITQPVFNKQDRQKRVQTIITTYENIGTSFADACLVQMAEQTQDYQILTVDSDFTIYRDSEGEPLSLIIPE